jgi:ABC-type phosphate transport system auxiliary subunit
MDELSKTLAEQATELSKLRAKNARMAKNINTLRSKFKRAKLILDKEGCDPVDLAERVVKALFILDEK